MNCVGGPEHTAADVDQVGGADRVADADQVFELERPRLTGLSYRMLGTLSDAEDVVQEAWLRWRRADHDAIRNPAAWLTTVTSRLALDRLRAQRRRREEYVGPWLPEPIRTGPPSLVDDDPAQAAELAESVTLGFLVVLDRLGPVERAVFLLADVFGEPYADIAEVVGRSPEACRQIASRARRKVRAEREPAAPADESLLAELMGAVLVGDVDRVISLLSPEVVLVSDGGPNRRAARRPVLGPAKVARLLVNLAQRLPADGEVAFEQVNAGPALVLRSEELTCALTADRDEHGEVSVVRILINPDKLAGLDRPVDFT
jgi:RNA polymerase sigma-70 factor (ECF subfamily)